MTARSLQKPSAFQHPGRENISAKVEEAKAAVASLSAQFTTVVAEDVGAIEEAYARAQAAGSERPEHARVIFEVAHNIKGQGASFGYQLLTDVAGLLCLRTRDVDPVSDEALSAIGFHVRALRVIVDGNIRGSGGEKGAALIAKLTALPGASLESST